MHFKYIQAGAEENYTFIDPTFLTFTAKMNLNRELLTELLNSLIHLCPQWLDLLSKLQHLLSEIYSRNKMYRANRNTSAELLPPTAHANEFVSQNIFGRWNAEAACRAASAAQLMRPILSLQKGEHLKTFPGQMRFFSIFMHHSWQTRLSECVHV